MHFLYMSIIAPFGDIIAFTLILSSSYNHRLYKKQNNFSILLCIWHNAIFKKNMLFSLLQ